MKARPFWRSTVHETRAEWGTASTDRQGCDYLTIDTPFAFAVCGERLDNVVVGVVLMADGYSLTCPECIAAVENARRCAELAAH